MTKKKEPRRLAPAKNGNFSIEKPEHEEMKWERILVRSGFVYKKLGQGFDMTPETAQNLIFFEKLLKAVGLEKSLQEKLFLPPSPTVDQSEWLQAVEKCHTGAEGGLYDELDIMDTYMAGIVRWLNEIGIFTDISCDGHERKPPSLCLRNKQDACIVNACLALLSGNVWRFQDNRLTCRQMVRNGFSNNNPRFRRYWLLDVAEKLHEKKNELQELVVKMREFVK